MTVYLWDAPGPENSSSGVSDRLDAACAAAAACLTSGRAVTAKVEAALLATSWQTLEPVHEPTGTVWQARRRDGGVRWEQTSAGRPDEHRAGV